MKLTMLHFFRVYTNDTNEISLTPTENLEPPFEPSRRNSTGIVLSPDVVSEKDSEISETSDRFYFLKKDSQRRLTLVKVLNSDCKSIMRSWKDKIVANMPDNALNQVGFSN